MKLYTNKKASDLVPEGEYPAELRAVTYKNENKKCILDFEINAAGKAVTVPKEVPADFDSGPLRKDLEILNGAEFTRKQVDEEGVDPERFVGSKCRVFVIHKRTSGGRVVAVVNVVLPLVSIAVAPPGFAATPAVAPPATE